MRFKLTSHTFHVVILLPICLCCRNDDEVLPRYSSGECNVAFVAFSSERLADVCSSRHYVIKALWYQCYCVIVVWLLKYNFSMSDFDIQIYFLRIYLDIIWVEWCSIPALRSMIVLYFDVSSKLHRWWLAFSARPGHCVGTRWSAVLSTRIYSPSEFSIVECLAILWK